MYCPTCRTEYREGFSECADCGAALVAELPPEANPEYQEYETILTTASADVLTFAQSVLEGAGIDYLVKGEEMDGVLVSHPIDLQVMPENAKEARELLADVEQDSVERLEDMEDEEEDIDLLEAGEEDEYEEDDEEELDEETK